MKTKLSNDMNVILGALVRRIKQRAYLDTDEEIARWIEEYCEQSNSHKHSVMQGLPTDEEIRAQALLMENKFDNHTAKIIARASYESGARWVISKLSGSPTVASSAAGQNVSGGLTPEALKRMYNEELKYGHNAFE